MKDNHNDISGKMEDSDSRKKEKNHLSDAVSLWSQMKCLEKELKQKRKWVMGLASHYGSDLKRLKSDLQMDELILPETISRGDDLFYENAKKYVEKGFRASPVADNLPVFKEIFQNSNMHKTVLRVLDDLTTNGLYVLATVVTGGPILHSQTRSKMKKTIKESLMNVHQRRCPEDNECQMCNHWSRFICNPDNFRQNHAVLIPPTVQSHFGTIMNVLDDLEDMPFVALSAMHRRLQGLPASLPSLDPSRSGWSQKGLVACIRRQSLCMISCLDEQDNVPIPLIKAMAVASLFKKLDSVEKPISVSFCDYAPDVKDLQDKLIKSITMLAQKVKVPELDAVKDLMFQSSKSEMHAGCLRKTVKRVLTELLLECSEFDAIPISMLNAISILNASPAMSVNKKLSKEVIEGEVESILRVSAQVRHILWDFLPDVKVEMDYADAYMEELEESDDGELFDDFKVGEQLGRGDKSGSLVKEQLDEEVASATVATFVSPLSSRKLNDAIEQCQLIGNSSIFPSSAIVASESKCSSTNQYLALQDLSDEASLVSYQIIGQVLQDFAREDGLTLSMDDQVYLKGGVSSGDEESVSDNETTGSFILRAVEKFLPSFPRRDLEEAKTFLKL